MSECRLILGDALAVLPTLESGSVDAVVTDPPYMLGAASARRSADKAIGWADINNAAHWYAAWFAEVWRVLTKRGPFWLFGNWRSLPVYQCAASKVPGMGLLSVVVWDKQWPSVGSTRGLRQNYELVALMAKPEFAIRDRGMGDIWRCKWTSAKPSGHPQEKPVELVRRMLRASELAPGSLVLDPFMGSGTSGVAAAEERLDFLGVELDEAHHLASQRRLADARGPLFATAGEAPP